MHLHKSLARSLMQNNSQPGFFDAHIPHYNLLAKMSGKCVIIAVYWKVLTFGGASISSIRVTAAVQMIADILIW